MKKHLLTSALLAGLLLTIGCTSTNHRQPQSEAGFTLGTLTYHVDVPLGVVAVNPLIVPMMAPISLRTGVYAEDSNTNFKGCVLYLEGLADSIKNHDPLFTKLSKNGYRVITFDYMGQGGSQGSMNDTRIYDPLIPDLEIGNQARFVWNSHPECAQSKKMVIGWSTGGLATYRLAHQGWADAVVLIAPGIHPKAFVGEAAHNKKMMVNGSQVITERTLTRNTFVGRSNPHLDPINPISPTAVPLFAANLMGTAVLSHFWDIPDSVHGLVFLSGVQDTYVDLKPTQDTLTEHAKRFTQVPYDGALHEIDNEIDVVAEDMQTKTVEFFDAHYEGK